MTRRGLLRLLSMGVIGHTLDVDKLLWIPGAKTIFLPPVVKPISFYTLDGKKMFTLSQIVDMEMKRQIPRIKEMMEKNDVFYSNITKRDVTGRRK